MSRRLLWEDEVINVIGKHTNDDDRLDNDISCILEEVDSGWVKCVPGQMPEDDERYKGRKRSDVLVTTAKGEVTKVQRSMICDSSGVVWFWRRIYGEPKAWLPLPEPYEE